MLNSLSVPFYGKPRNLQLMSSISNAAAAEKWKIPRNCCGDTAVPVKSVRNYSMKGGFKTQGNCYGRRDELLPWFHRGVDEFKGSTQSQPGNQLPLLNLHLTTRLFTQVRSLSGRSGAYGLLFQWQDPQTARRTITSLLMSFIAVKRTKNHYRATHNWYWV